MPHPEDMQSCGGWGQGHWSVACPWQGKVAHVVLLLLLPSTLPAMLSKHFRLCLPALVFYENKRLGQKTLLRF